MIKFKVWTGTQMLDSGFSINPHGDIYDIHDELQSEWVALQFIGTQDLNDENVYFCDIVNHTSLGEMEVKYDDDQASFYLSSDTVKHCYINGNFFEVIGNIHQNEESK